MKSKRVLTIFIILVSFNILFAIDEGGLKRVDYESFEKYWEKEGYVEDYLKRSQERYRSYLSKTVFDEKLEISVKGETIGFGSSDSGNVLVVISQNCYNPITMDEIAIYKSDLESEGYFVKLVTSTNSNDPVAFRDYLYQEWADNNIDGVFLIGGLPIAWYEMPIFNEEGDTTGWDVFPCDLFYMDLDGEWLDSARDNGINDDHAGNLEPDVWIGRLYTPTMTYHDANEYQLIENYLQKTHKYREGTLRLKNQGFSYVQKDWACYHMENEVFKLYDEVTYVNDGINGKVTKYDYKRRINSETNNKYEWMYLAAHSSHCAHYFEDGLFYSEEIEPLDVQVHFYLNFNCSAANYRDNDCLCNWYVMQEPYGLLSVGSTKGGSMLDQYDYYEPLSDGYTFGEAFKYWGVRHFETRDWHYGMTCIGDPTLKISRFMTNPGPKFCYAISPERDARIDTTNPTFIWSASDSADSYMVEIYKGNSLVFYSNFMPDTLFQIPDDKLSAGFSYMWTVEAYSGGDCVDFTQLRKFSIRDTTANFLSDFEIDSIYQEWGSLGLDVSVEGNPISIAGHKYEKGLGTHAESIIRYNLEGKYKWFTADIGHDDESHCENIGDDGVTFEVRLDGETIYGPSKVFKWGDEPEHFKLNIFGGTVLELLVHRGSNNYCDHSDWADARLWKNDVGIKDIAVESMPEKIKLVGNYPNPFNSNTKIVFELNKDADVRISIYNILGREVANIVSGKYTPGKHEINWNGTNETGIQVPSGIYFYQLKSGDYSSTKKMVIMR